MKNLCLSLLVIIILLVSSSCKKQTETANDASADVFVRSLTYNGLLAFSTVYSVTSSNTISKVTVDIPGGSSFYLTDHDGTGTAFFKDTSMAGLSYSHSPAAAGIYNFHVSYTNGEEKLYTNTLSTDYLLPPVIDSLYKKTDGVTLRLKWKPVVGAQAYQIRIHSGQNQILPWLEFADPSGMYTERLISDFAYYLPGTLTFELRAVIYESSDGNYVQAISYNSASIDL